MRVEDGKHPAPQPSPQRSFAAELKKAPKPQPQLKAAQTKAAPAKPAQPKPASPRPSARPATPARASARKQEAVSFQKSLESRRSEAEVVRPEHKRLALEIAKRLEPEPEPERERSAPPPEPPRIEAAQPVASPAAAPVESTPAPVRAEALAEQIAAMLERVELVHRAEGPALELALSEGAAAQVRVTRTAKGEVALSLQARTPAERRALQAQVGRVRQALTERGLKVREVSVG